MRLKLPFKDSDAIIEDLEGATLVKIVDKKGADYLSDIERRVVLSTPAEGYRVFAAGAGGVDEDTIAHLNRLGPAIHLDLTFKEAMRRSAMKAGQGVPIGPDDFGTFIRRKRYYSRAALKVWTESLSIDEILDAIIRLV